MKIRSILSLAFGTIVLTAAPAVLAATRIKFAPGSYCGSYSGDFSRGRVFVLNLARGQTLTYRNIGSSDQYNITVTGAGRTLRGQQVAPEQINYQIPRKGDYYISVNANAPFSNVEFCAY